MHVRIPKKIPRIPQEGISPLKGKIESIQVQERPKPLKQLRSLLGAVPQLNRLISGLAKICHPYREILSKENKYIWSENHEIAFQQIKTEVQRITSNAHFDKKAPARVTCDASLERLGAVSKQLLGGIWKPIAFASRFLSNCEQRHSTNELELSAVVWSVEHFQNYLYGRKFRVRSDHRARFSALKDNRGIKTLMAIDRYARFPFVKITNSNTTEAVLTFLD